METDYAIPVLAKAERGPTGAPLKQQRPLVHQHNTKERKRRLRRRWNTPYIN